jgi:branched-chain amino acid transport system substrate-binding protein
MKNKIIIGIISIVVIIIIVALGVKNNSKQLDDENVIKVGAVLPLTGNAAGIGENIRDGLIFFIEEVNGLTDGVKFVLDVQDSKSDPKQANSIMKKFLSQNPKPSIIYSAISGVTLNLQPTTETEHIVLLGCVGSNELISKDSKYTYRNFIAPNRVGEQIASYAKQVSNNKKLYILYLDNTFGISYKDAVVEEAKKKSLEIGATIPYTTERNDYKSILAKLNPDDIDCMYIAGVGENIGILVRKLREAGYTGVILGDANMNNGAAIKVAGDAMRNVKYLDFDFDKKSDMFENFSKSYYQKFNKEPDNFALIAFEGMMTYFKASEKLGADCWNSPKKVNGFETTGLSGKVKILDFEFLYPLTFRSVLE